MCYTLIGLPLIAYVSFYGMMQGDNANIKEQIGIALFSNHLSIKLILSSYCCILPLYQNSVTQQDQNAISSTDTLGGNYL